MAESPSGKLRIWEGWAPPPPPAALPSPPEGQHFPGPLHPVALADRLAARECLRTPGWGRESPEPFSLQWFLDVEQARHGRRGRWIPRLLEFTKHRGERLLGRGLGLGPDWVQYARHGAEVVACCPSRDHLALVRRHFEVRGLRGAFLHANPVALPLETASIDVACSWLPVREDVKADPRLAQKDPTEPFWSSLVSFTRYRPTLSEYPQVSNAMDVAGDSVVNGGDPAQAAQKWAQDVAKAVGSDKVTAG